MRKRMVSLLLCFMLLAGLLPTTAMAANDMEPLPTPTGLKWGGYSNDVWSFYDADSGFVMPEICQWDGSNLIDVIGDYGIEADYKLYRKADASAGSDELVADQTVVMWPEYRPIESTSIVSELVVNEYDDGTSNSGHLKSGDYYFTVQYVISDTLRNSTNAFDNLSDSAIAKSDIWHYTQPSEKISAPVTLSYANGKSSWAQPDGDTSQIAAYVIVVADANSSSLIQLVSNTECSADIASWLENASFDQFTFKVAALSRDITKIQSSDWSAASAVFNADGTVARSASLSGVISGKVHQSIDTKIRLNLTGDSFDPSKIEGYDAESGILPAGIELTDYLTLVNPEYSEFHLFNEAELKKGDQMMTVRVSGSSSQNYDGQVNMTISGQMLTSGKELAVTPSDDCMWHISPQAAPPRPEEGKYDLWFFGKQVTVDNAADILGDGAAAFDPLTNTLTLRPGSGNSYGVVGNTPMLKSGLDSLTLRVERAVMMRSQDGYGIEAKNLTVEIADPDVTLTVIGKTGAFSQTPLNVTEEIFAGANADSAKQQTNWMFGPTTTPYVRLGVHKWNSRWLWNTYLNGHWRKCDHAACAAVKDAAKHTLEWCSDSKPYGAKPGSRHQECQICGYKGNPEPVPGTAPGITTDSLLSSELGMAYRGTVGATGTAPLTWKITSGKLPDGLTLNTETGEITGKSTKAGTFTFTVQVTNQVLGAVGAKKSYTIKINESSNELKLVKRLTKVSLANADEESRETIENAIYNLLFKAQFRPSVKASAGVGNTGKGKAKFTGTKAKNYEFTIQNYDYSANNEKRQAGVIEDAILGKVKVGQVGGCNAYAFFNTVYTYKSKGKEVACSKVGKDLTTAAVKDFIHKNVDPGEMLRYTYSGGWHSIVFLGESENGNGFYYINYNGGRRMQSICKKCKKKTYGKTKKCSKKCGSTKFTREELYTNKDNSHHNIQVAYQSYSEFASNANTLYTWDTNGGSYYAKTAKAWKNIGKTNKAKKTIVRLKCPVEASITLDGFILDSEYGPFERSFGKVERVGDGIVFTLDYSEDYVLDIRGTGEGTMDAEIEYLDENDTSFGTQCFEKVPITPDTQISARDLSPETTAVLVVADTETETAWGANLGETATAPDESLLSNNDEPDMSDSEEDTEFVSGDSSFSGSSVSKTVSVGSSVNGSVAVNPKNASKGDTVTVTVRPDTGYQLDTITVTDQTGKEITLTDNGDGTFSFTMPASSVTVKAAFQPIAFPVFTDVPSGSYYEEAVRWAAENGVTAGTDSAHFSPDGICTRVQAVTFLWRAAGSPAPKSSAMPFIDVSAGSYYYNAVLWAVENGITKGTSDTAFSPDKTCTRAQIVTFLWRSQNAPAAGSSNPFTDVAAGAYYADAVLWAVKNDITKGTGATTFGPDADCTRAQIVTFLWRTMA